MIYILEFLLWNLLELLLTYYTQGKKEIFYDLRRDDEGGGGEKMVKKLVYFT